jgi:hypothetical protein
VTAELTEHGPPLGAKQCVWGTETMPVKQYSLSVQRTEDMAEALRDAGQSGTKLYQESKPYYESAVGIAGIGDEAVIAKSTIIARKGDVFIDASTMFGDSPAAIAALKALTTRQSRAPTRRSDDRGRRGPGRHCRTLALAVVELVDDVRGEPADDQEDHDQQPGVDHLD